MADDAKTTVQKRARQILDEVLLIAQEMGIEDAEVTSNMLLQLSDEELPPDRNDLDDLATMVQVFCEILDIPLHTIVLGSDSGYLILRSRLVASDLAELGEMLGRD
jgi:hypothetical protein